MLKKISGLVFLIVMMICSISLSVTYSKYLLIKSIDGEIITRSNCIDMGITSLGECMLVMDTTTSNVKSAKLSISEKGEADLSRIAPTINFVEQSNIVENSAGVFSGYSSMSLASSYTFDKETGYYTLIDAVHTTLSDDYIGYYTCGLNIALYTNCTTMYKIENYIIQETTSGLRQIVTEALKYTYKTVDSLDSEIGLYATKDDYGTSYYYRGNVKNNYVSYAGYIWRIVRQNGDGSIRIIYAGKSTSDTGADTAIGTSIYNEKSWDPTYVGYMYSEDFAEIVGTAESNYALSENLNYYFGESYQFDENTKKFSITGKYLKGTWKDNYEEIIKNYPYTCVAITSSAECNYITKITGYVNAYAAKATFVTYGSVDYDSTLKNKDNSTIKTYIDTWYKNNLLSTKDTEGNLYSSYLSDNIFCNDRTYYLGDGYSFSPRINYTAHQRQNEETPTLTCKQLADQFTVESTNGNGKLTYPIALLTLDEYLYAGGKMRNVNSSYYLNENIYVWTMTPATFDSSTGLIRLFTIDSDASLLYHRGDMGYYVRPVINLRSDIQITSGDGTAENPYIVSL